MEINNEKYKGNKKRREYKKDKEFSIRSINLKLNPTKEIAKLLDNDFCLYSHLHDIGVNRYSRLPDPTTEAMSEEAKKMRRELQSPVCTGTFVDLAVGSGGAESYFRTLRKMAKDDIIRRDREIKRIEKDNANLIKLKSVWFDPIKKREGKCSMCERFGNIFWKSNEFEEYLCEVCIIDFFAYREPLRPINRYIMKNYFLCKDLISSNNKLSEGLAKEIKRQSEKFNGQSYVFKNTVSNKIKLKGGQLKVDFDTTMAAITLSDPNIDKVQIPFSGQYYYTNYPAYGKDSDKYKFKRLIKDFVDGKGYGSLIMRQKNNQKEYFLSIPTHYPMIDKERKVELVEGCILVSQRKVLIYVNGIAKFVELFNPYIKKRIYGIKNKAIQKQNTDLCLCDWTKIPKKNHMLLNNLKNKLGFDWIDEHNVVVTKSADNNSISIRDDNNRLIEIDIDRDIGLGELRSIENGNSYSHRLYIVEKKNDIDNENVRYRKIDIYIEPQIPMPKKYSNGNLLIHIRHKNKETARQIVEDAKKMLSKNGSLLLVDYKGMHSAGEGIVPMVALNDQILNMLRYDSIYGGSINWSRLKILRCPNCHKILPEKGDDGKRFIIRDIFLSDTKHWVCEDAICNKKINSPLIAVGRHIMNADLKELLKRPSKKEKDESNSESINPPY